LDSRGQVLARPANLSGTDGLDLHGCGLSKLANQLPVFREPPQADIVPSLNEQISLNSIPPDSNSA
jgi:hypothetical protein